ncbi:MAG: hypothetical protein IJP16_01925 [Clostridia bacterium]|nr:hypothetical protein [Clostridia bacterium]
MYQQTISVIESKLLASGVLPILIALFWLICAIKFSREFGSKAIILLCVAYLLFTLYSFGRSYCVFKEDVKNESYVTYEGKFECKQKDDKYPRTIKLSDSSGTKVELMFESDAYYGEYTGKIVYGQKSRYIVYLKAY